MSSDDYEEDEYYDDDEAEDEMSRYSTDKYEQVVPWVNQLERISPVTFTVTGDLSGDIDWNNIEAQITMLVPEIKSAKWTPDTVAAYVMRYGNIPLEYEYLAKVSPFTNNCGVKALHHVYTNGQNEQQRL